MYVVLGLLAALGLGGIIFMFLSKKSSRLEKLVALVALVISALVLGICGTVLIFGGDGEEQDPFTAAFEPPPVEEKGMSDISELLLFLLIVLVFFGFIVFIGIRDKKIRDTGTPNR